MMSYFHTSISNTLSSIFKNVAEVGHGIPNGPFAEEVSTLATKVTSVLVPILLYGSGIYLFSQDPLKFAAALFLGMFNFDINKNVEKIVNAWKNHLVVASALSMIGICLLPRSIVKIATSSGAILCGWHCGARLREIYGPCSSSI